MWEGDPSLSSDPLAQGLVDHSYSLMGGGVESLLPAGLSIPVVVRAVAWGRRSGVRGPEEGWRRDKDKVG